MKKNAICIAEDHTILREGIKSMLSSNPNFEVVSDAKDGIELLKYIVRDNPDLVLLDLTMPKMNGLEVIKEIKKRRPEIKMLVLTVHAATEYIDEAFRAGADGYLLKDVGLGELIIAIEAILEGGSYLSPKISNRVIKGFLSEEKPENSRMSDFNLTTREWELLKLIAEGYRNKEIAEFLVISVKTVEKHRANMMRKLNIHNTAELTAFAIEKGLLVCSTPINSSLDLT